MFRMLAAIAIAAVSLAAASPAAAQDGFLVFVPRGDLADDAGGRALAQRLRAAARRTCGAATNLREAARLRDCRAAFAAAAATPLAPQPGDRVMSLAARR